MVKTKDKSFFLRMHIESPKADRIFSSKPVFEDEEIQVLQTDIIQPGWLLIECIYVKDLIQIEYE
jgi:hypothetical protein